MVGVAVKVTEEPAHIGLNEAAIDTLTGRFGLTVIIISFEVAGLTDGQIAVEVMTHLTLPLFGRAALV